MSLLFYPSLPFPMPNSGKTSLTPAYQTTQ